MRNYVEKGRPTKRGRAQNIKVSAFGGPLALFDGTNKTCETNETNGRIIYCKWHSSLVLFVSFRAISSPLSPNS